MAKAVKREYILEGLDCANCAAEIEANVNKISGIASAAMNFATKTLTIEAGEDGLIDNIVTDTNAVIKKLEPHVVVKEKMYQSLRNGTYPYGVSCADCAAKLKKENQGFTRS